MEQWIAKGAVIRDEFKQHIVEPNYHSFKALWNDETTKALMFYQSWI